MASDYKRGETNYIRAEFPKAPDSDPTIIFVDNDNVEDETITVGDIVGSIGDTVFEALMTIGADTPLTKKKALFTAPIDGITYGIGVSFQVNANSIDDLSLGTGQYTATINVKVDSVNIENARVTIHNAANDDEPYHGAVFTDLNGNAVFTIEGNVYVRVSKAGKMFTATAKNITGSGTYNITGTGASIDPPGDPELCTLFLYPKTLENVTVTDLTVNISSKEKLTKVDGQYIEHAEDTFSYDSGSGSFQYSAMRGAVVHIKCEALGINKTVTVPDEETKDLDTLIPGE